ncbi:MAG: hypothetical protein ABGY24_16605 [bacterium]
MCKKGGDDDGVGKKTKTKTKTKTKKNAWGWLVDSSCNSPCRRSDATNDGSPRLDATR